jgi:type IV pilus assembly protein PilE
VSPVGSRSKGFTLIELMIALAVVAILGAVALPSYRDSVTRSSLASGTANLKELRTRMEQRYADNRSYQASVSGCAIPNFIDTSDGFSYACSLTNSGQGFTWTATGSGKSAGFTYTIDEAGIETTTAARTGWTTATLPVARFVLRKGG